MASLSSPKAGSIEDRGWESLPTLLPAVGVVCEARRDVRDGGRRGVVGRDGIAPDRVRECDAERWWALSVAGVEVVAIVLVDRIRGRRADCEAVQRVVDARRTCCLHSFLA